MSGGLARGIFEALASPRLGEKLILHIPVAGTYIDIDLITIIMSWVVMAVILGIALVLRRSLRQPVDEKPSRGQVLLEATLDFLKAQLAGNFSDEKLARLLFPFVSTLFLFVLISNWIAVIPYFQSPTSDLNVTLSFALLVTFLSQFYAVRMNGVRRYLKGFIEPYPFLLPLNIVGEIAKPLSHSFRLFGNMFGGAAMLTILYMFAITSVGWPLIVNAFYGLFEGAIQAFVFAILAVAYINVAVESQ